MSRSPPDAGDVTAVLVRLVRRGSPWLGWQVVATGEREAPEAQEGEVMAETWDSANRRRACIDCGDSGALLYTCHSSRRPEGFPTRVCYSYLHSGRWNHVQLIRREPLPSEQPDQTDPGSIALAKRPDQEPR